MKQLLTPKQEQLLKVIEKFQLTYGTSPTLRELCKLMKVSSDNAVFKHLVALEQKGYLRRREDVSRGIEMLAHVKQRLQQPAEVRLPLLGRIPAGGPVLSEENVEDWMTLSEDVVVRPADSFLLRVTGDSMVNAGIFEGDLVVACRSLQAKDADIVIALVDNMNTVKRLRKTAQGFFLQPENPAYQPIYPEKDLQIQGVVTALIRSYRRR